MHIGGGNEDGLPPPCFFVEAVRNLRADASEQVLILAGTGGGQRVAHNVVDALRAQTSPTATRTPATPWWNSTEALVMVMEHGSAVTQREDLLTALRTAQRVVWGNPSSPMPHVLPLARGRRRPSDVRLPGRPHEVVWTWCARSPRQNGDHDERRDCPQLPRNVTDFEVQVQPRPRSATHSLAWRTARPGRLDYGLPSHVCLRALMVRSTWHGSQWVDLSAVYSAGVELEQTRAGLSRGEWMHDNVCLAHSLENPSRGSERWSILAQAHAATHQLLWPLPWQDLYAEYTPGYLRLDSETADHWVTNLVNMTSSPLRQCTWHNTTAFVTELTMDNLYHALIHAVPTREFFARVQLKHGGRGMALIPHYIQYWPRSFHRAVGWQILARSLGVSEADWPEVAARAQRFTKMGGCNCFRRLYGGHASFMPPPYMKSMARVIDFRSALADSSGRRSAQRQILFQLRHTRVRQIVNEQELVSSVKADPIIGGLVRFVIMETLSVMEQYALISASPSLAGMHGMGLAWTMLLASEAGGSSMLEITGVWPKFNRLDYYSLSRANGVRYVRLSQPNAPECVHCKRCSYRTCGNITANTTQIIDKLRLMASWWS